VAFVPGFGTPLLERVAEGLLRQFQSRGHQVQDTPDDETDVILTTAPFDEPLGWRQALLLMARRRFKLSRSPALYTLVHAPRKRFEGLLEHFRVALAKEPADPADYAFPGLTSRAYRVLLEQGRRGGPILALERLVQAQTKSIRVILLVGEESPMAAYHFDLVGAHPRTDAGTPPAFYDDVVLRIVTTVSANEVVAHQVASGAIPAAVWKRLSTPAAMTTAGRELGERGFFTEMVRIADLVKVPAVADAVAEQYSEGCFGTWEPELNVLLATVTGSARPVDKGSVTDDDLAVIAGVRPEGNGVVVRHVEGKRDDPPSSEAVEMMSMNDALPVVTVNGVGDFAGQVPVVRSRLHGHRGIAGYDPQLVEYAPLDPPYYHYLVSCGTDAQARGIKDAFARSEALQNPDDPRQIVFTVLPGHGVFLVEKWVAGKAPFQVIWEAMDDDRLQVSNRIPQGPMTYARRSDGSMVLQETQGNRIFISEPCVG
jgi:hypothetical protein